MLDIIWNKKQILQITDIPFEHLVINNEKIFITSCHFYLISLLKIYKSSFPYA